ncbi:MAG: hypothetical protein ACM31C_23545 [Acidobacteriota bacterium]
MRNAVLVAAVLVAACHPPSLRERAAQLGGRFAALGHATVRVVAPVAPRIDVHVIANAAVQAAAPQVLAAMPAPQPIELHRTVIHHSSAPVQTAAAPEPVMTVNRVDAAPPTFFGMRYAKAGGGDACQRFDTLDACNSACTSLSQQRGMRGEPNANCSCLEDAPGC